MIESETDAKRWLAAMPEASAEAMSKLALLAELLIVENERQNLISRATIAHIWQRHFADSAQLLCHVSRETSPWLDLGTGAGFPGLVIAILRPESEVVLIESRAARADWLERVRNVLGLHNVQVEGERLERVDTIHASVISARAFAPLERLLTLATRFSTNETRWLLPKGRSAQQELNELRGWRNTFTVTPSLTDREAGIIVGELTGRKGKSS